MENSIRTLRKFGQSVWYDNIQRSMLSSGELLLMVEQDGLAGMTSNPTIFEKAIQGDETYNDALQVLLRNQPDLDDKAVFYDLAIEDIQHAADILRPVYENTGHEDGMVSLEVSPDLAHDTEATIAEAKALHTRVGRPNLMIKVPATPEGIPAVEALIAEGINVNATLLFSVKRYKEVAKAYLAGLEARVRAGQPISDVVSVASFFVSRVDSKIDKLLDGRATASNNLAEREQVEAWKGRAAVANAGLAYSAGQEIFTGNRFREIETKGARQQRLLWASTGTKDPSYSDILYVETLVGPNTVNTMPPATYAAYRDHGKPEVTIDEQAATATQVLREIAAFGIDLDQVTDELEREGVASFAESFRTLLTAIAEKRQKLSMERAS